MILGRQVDRLTDHGLHDELVQGTGNLVGPLVPIHSTFDSRTDSSVINKLLVARMTQRAAQECLIVGCR